MKRVAHTVAALLIIFASQILPAVEPTTRPADLDGQPLGPPVETAEIRVGDLRVVFRDNSRSPEVLSGLDSLFNVKEAAEFDAFDPDSRGASAGLNFEHIISGHESPHNKFTPRHGRYTLHKLPDGRAVVLVRDSKDDPWAVSSTLKYTVTEPHYIDFEFRCRFHDAKLLGGRGYAALFWANYMNDVAEVPIHFLGVESSGGKEKWIAAEAPPGHKDWNQGGTYRSLAADADLACDDAVTFRLNHWSYDWPRFTRPFYYGRAAHDMTYILMFDRMHSAEEQIRFSLFKFKLKAFPRPAWDFQYVVQHAREGREYGFKGRAVWKRFVSADDCLKEYETWRVYPHNE